MKVWIAQCLCPNRHAIFAGARECADDAEVEKLKDAVREGVDELLRKGLNPWCGICYAKVDTWAYEADPTRFATMAEAAPEINKAAAANIMGGVVYGELLGPQTPHKGGRA